MLPFSNDSILDLYTGKSDSSQWRGRENKDSVCEHSIYFSTNHCSNGNWIARAKKASSCRRCHQKTAKGGSKSISTNNLEHKLYSCGSRWDTYATYLCVSGVLCHFHSLHPQCRSVHESLYLPVIQCSAHFWCGCAALGRIILWRSTRLCLEAKLETHQGHWTLLLTLINGNTLFYFISKILS